MKLKSYVYWTNEKAIATTFSKVCDAFLDRPHKPNAVPLNFPTGPYEFHCCAVEDDSEDVAKIFQRIATALGMETQILHSEYDPTKHEPKPNQT